MFENKTHKKRAVRDRAKSISRKKLDEKNREEKKAWLWDPNEVTSFGNRRLLRSVLLAGKPVDEPINIEEDLDDFHDLIACLMTDAYFKVIELFKEFTQYHSYWAHLGLHPEKYPNQGYPRGANYTWTITIRHRDKSITETEKVLPVAEYVEKVFNFFVRQMENDSVFPSNELDEFPRDFSSKAKQMNTLLFRVLAIILTNEDPSVHYMAKPLKEVLHKVLYYSWKWEMLDDDELTCIDYIVDPIKKQYDLDYAAEVEHGVVDDEDDY